MKKLHPKATKDVDSNVSTRHGCSGWAAKTTMLFIRATKSPEIITDKPNAAMIGIIPNAKYPAENKRTSAIRSTGIVNPSVP